jgi:heptosyltransferase-2
LLQLSSGSTPFLYTALLAEYAASANMRSHPSNPRLLVIELWGLGDLVIATPFLRAAVEKYRVTVLAKPYARDLQPRLWPGVEVLPFVAPWTAFRGKYRLQSWPWLQMFSLTRSIREMRFDVGVSARWDPRNHFLLALAGAKSRIGFPRVGSGIFLTKSLKRPDVSAHRYEDWRTLGHAIGVESPLRENIPPLRRMDGHRDVLIHTGAGQPVRVWPLDRYRNLARRLREKNCRVQVACDPDQRDWWLRAGENAVATPQTVTELLALLDNAGAFIGNDSGPGHLAAFCGVPTFTIFGPQLPEWFAPLHPAAEWVEGKPCPYKPCSDYCRFASPLCMDRITEEEIWARVESFLSKNIPAFP